MDRCTRRRFLQMGAALAASLGLQREQMLAMAAGLEKIAAGGAPVLWLQGMNCTGCSVSLLNTTDPGPVEVLTEIISLVYHSNLSAAQGNTANQLIEDAVKGGGYYLIVEGSIPLDMPEACVIGGKPLTSILPDACRNAKAIVAAGTCSAFGGIPAAEGNQTGAGSLREFMQKHNLPVKDKLVNCPGCPMHPEELIGTLAYVVGKGYPKVNPELLTPEMFYQHSVHDNCPRFHYWEKREFAQKFGEQGCLFKLGCLGPLSHTNCPQRQWNGGVNWCIRAGAPCLGCTGKDFSRRRDFPFYRKGEESHAVAYQDQDRKGNAK
jgi:hydrogenase small subunit